MGSSDRLLPIITSKAFAIFQHLFALARVEVICGVMAAPARTGRFFANFLLNLHQFSVTGLENITTSQVFIATDLKEGKHPAKSYGFFNCSPF